MQNYVVEVECDIIKVYSIVLIHYDYFTLSGAVKYCNQRVCLSVCSLAYLKNIPNLKKYSLHVTCDLSSVILCKQCDML